MVAQQQAPVEVKYTRLFSRIEGAWNSGKRHLWVEGGTWASKTWTIMQFLTLLGEHYPEPLHITATSETMPHLKRGVMLDFRAIMGDRFDERRWNRTDFIYRWPSGSWIEFTSADTPSKFTGGRRDILFANEVNHVERDTFRQGDMRTRLFTIADWNPESEFWFHQDNLIEDEDAEYIHTTYMDALEVLPEQQRKEIERYERLDPNWWNIYGLGILGKVSDLVHPLFKQVDKLPEGPVIYGLDYGFASDPTVLVANVIVGDNLYSHQVFYETQPMTNDDIARKMDLLKVSHSAPIYPDPSEPKSAEEIRRKGFNVGETEKGAGSVEYGTKKVNSYYQHWTKESLECIKEQRNFKYVKKRDSSGQEYISSDTTHRWSHSMSARRYAVASHQMDSGTGSTVISFRRRNR